MRYRFMKIFYIIPLIALLSYPVQSQNIVLITDPHFRPDASAAIDSLYNRNPEAARLLMAPWKETFTNHPVWPLWDAMEVWWDSLTDLHDESRDQELFNKMAKADYEAGLFLRKYPGHPDALLVRAVSNGFSARQQANRDQWLSSVNTARRAYQAQILLMDHATEIPDNLLAEGLKSYYAAWLPENYPAVRTVSWFLPSGDKQEGLRLLERAAEEAIFARPEAIYFLGNIRLHYENDLDQALVHFRILVENYPANGYYRRMLVRNLFHLNRNNEAELEIEKTLRDWIIFGYSDYNPLAEELHYWQGRLQLRSTDFEKAYQSFTKGIIAGNKLPGTNKRYYFGLNTYYAGHAADLNGERTVAQGHLQDVIKLQVDNEIKQRARTRLAGIQ